MQDPGMQDPQFPCTSDEYYRYDVQFHLNSSHPRSLHPHCYVTFPPQHVMVRLYGEFTTDVWADQNVFGNLVNGHFPSGATWQGAELLLPRMINQLPLPAELCAQISDLVCSKMQQIRAMISRQLRYAWWQARLKYLRGPDTARRIIHQSRRLAPGMCKPSYPLAMYVARDECKMLRRRLLT